MIEEASSHKRNLFEIENARNLSRRELVETFVPTQSFWRLLSAKHHVVLGSRGSGKTALARMLSHDHLAMLNEPRAQSAIRDQQFIGVYVPTRLEWVGALKNKPWQTEAQKEEFFQWRLNLSSCLALITTLESCVQTYCGHKGDQARAEREIASNLAEAWAENSEIETFDGLRRYLEDLEYQNNLLIAQLRAAGNQNPSATGPGAVFDSDLFVPMRRGITLVSRILKLPSACTWLVCLDEAEFLEELHHRIINSHMRAHTNNVFFKPTTMPYCHYTLATNMGVSLDVGHDFEYVYIDSDPILFARSSGEKSSLGTQFARTLFNRRVEASGLLAGRDTVREISIADFLGRSVLLDDKDEDWTNNSEGMNLLRKYCSTETIYRAEQLLHTPRFKSEVSRKIHGALLLRKAYEDTKGRGEPDIYSGATMAIRCGDANPRRLIRIFNALLLAAGQPTKRYLRVGTFLRLSPKTQTRVLRKLSTSALVRVQSEPQCGNDLYEFLRLLGDYMKWVFHEKPLTTDQITSINVDQEISDGQWNSIRRAVELGLLYPNIGAHQRDDMPNREGTFRLAFILAPHFFLLPRRGDSRKLSTIMKEIEAQKQSKGFDTGQLKLL